MQNAPIHSNAARAAVVALALTNACHAPSSDAVGAPQVASAATQGPEDASPTHAARNAQPPKTNGSAEIESNSMKFSESGQGRNIVILHGGGGPFTVAGLAKHLAEKSHVVVPTYPGWDGTPRPESLDNVAKLADECVRFLEEHDLRDVTVIGSSIGGWVGAELALRDEKQRLSGLVIINGLGVDVPGEPITNVTGFTPPQLAKVAYYDPAKFLANLPPLPPERLPIVKANQALTALFAGKTYGYDPTLRARLKSIHIPTLLLWGEADQIVTQEYGRAYATAIPQAQFASVANAGHLPWTEQPEATFSVLDRFVATVSRAR